MRGFGLKNFRCLQRLKNWPPDRGGVPALQKCNCEIVGPVEPSIKPSLNVLAFVALAPHRRFEFVLTHGSIQGSGDDGHRFPGGFAPQQGLATGEETGSTGEETGSTSGATRQREGRHRSSLLVQDICTAAHEGLLKGSGEQT